MESQWLTVKQLKDEFGISVSTQEGYRREKTIPFIKVGKTIKYHRQTINDWLLSKSEGDEKTMYEWTKYLKGKETK